MFDTADLYLTELFFDPNNFFVGLEFVGEYDLLAFENCVGACTAGLGLNAVSGVFPETDAFYAIIIGGGANGIGDAVEGDGSKAVACIVNFVGDFENHECFGSCLKNGRGSIYSTLNLYS